MAKNHPLFVFIKNFFVIFFSVRYKLYLYHEQFQGGICKMDYNTKPNPDDRSDNVEKLQEMISNTEENIHKAKASLQFTDSETQRQQIESKNQRREESIQSFKSEIQDEL